MNDTESDSDDESSDETVGNSSAASPQVNLRGFAQLRPVSYTSINVANVDDNDTSEAMSPSSDESVSDVSVASAQTQLQNVAQEDDLDKSESMSISSGDSVVDAPVASPEILSLPNMDDATIAHFASITNATPERAKQYLTVSEFDLEQAVQLYYLERDDSLIIDMITTSGKIELQDPDGPAAQEQTQPNLGDSITDSTTEPEETETIPEKTSVVAAPKPRQYSWLPRNPFLPGPGGLPNNVAVRDFAPRQSARTTSSSMIDRHATTPARPVLHNDRIMDHLSGAETRALFAQQRPYAELSAAKSLATPANVPRQRSRQRPDSELSAAESLATLSNVSRQRPQDLKKVDTQVPMTTGPATATPSTATPSSSGGSASSGSSASTLPSSISSAGSSTKSLSTSLTPLEAKDLANTVAVYANSFPDCPMSYSGHKFARELPTLFPTVYFPITNYLTLARLGIEDFDAHPNLQSLTFKRLDSRMNRLEHELLAINAASAVIKTRLGFTQQTDNLNIQQWTAISRRQHIGPNTEFARELYEHFQSNNATYRLDIQKLQATEQQLALAVVERNEELQRVVAEKQRKLESVPKFS